MKKYSRKCRFGILSSLAIVLTGASGLVSASIALTGYSENAGSFTATYAFTPDPSPGFVPPPGSLWNASLSEAFTPTNLGAGTFSFNWSGSHPPTGVAAAGNCTFSNSVLTGTPCNQSMSVADGTATDNYSFVVNLISGGGTATFTGTHTAAVVPLPAAAWLFGSGLVGVGLSARKKTARSV